MNIPAHCAAVCAAALLVASCRKEDPARLSSATPPSVTAETAEVPLSSMSRKQREAHRILEAARYLEQGLRALTALERSGQLTWISGNKADLGATAEALSSMREEIARTEADESQQYHHNSLNRLNGLMKQMLEFGNQAVLPQGSKEGREFATALLSATDAMETTSFLQENGLRGSRGAE